MDENRATCERKASLKCDCEKGEKGHKAKKDDRAGTSMAPATSSGYHHSLTREYLAAVL